MASELNQAISTPMDVCSFKAMSGVKISRVSIQPENRSEVSVGTGGGGDLYFSFPSRPDSFLNGMNSYLSFTYTFEGTTGAEANTRMWWANGNPASVISVLETTANATQIEMISDYNVLANLVDDFQGRDRTQTLGSILQDKSQTVVKEGFRRNPNAGQEGVLIERRVCIPLLSFACSTLADKYIPMGRDIGLRLRLGLADPLLAISAVVADANLAGFSPAYRLKDITYEAEYLTVPSNVYQSLLNEADGTFKVSGTGIGSFSVSGSAGQGQQTLLIPARYSSVRNFFTTNRMGTILTNKRANSVGSRCRDNITSYSYRISGQNYPNLPVSCDAFTSAECLTEVIKCWSGHADLGMNVSFTNTNFVENAGTGDIQGSFVVGLQFEESNFSALQMSGINTTSGSTFLEVGYASGQTSSATVFNTFAFYDTIMEITQNGDVIVSK
jgi:hypothetical protein